MKKLCSSLIVMVALAAFLPVAALAAGAAGFPTWSSQFAKGRFTLLPLFNNAAVFDKETGLVWEQTIFSGSLEWNAAYLHCLNQNLGHRKGWRLPTAEELASLMDTSQTNPSLPASHPFTNPNVGVLQGGGTVPIWSAFWSATNDPGNASNGLAVDFATADAASILNKSAEGLVWCVRGGQGVEIQ